MTAYNTPAELCCTELGMEQQCKTCGDWWPLDRTFWHVNGSRGRLKAHCKDCACAQQRAKQGYLEPTSPPPVPDVFSAVQWGGQ